MNQNPLTPQIPSVVVAAVGSGTATSGWTSSRTWLAAWAAAGTFPHVMPQPEEAAAGRNSQDVAVRGSLN
jgi:hypothetical protein